MDVVAGNNRLIYRDSFVSIAIIPAPAGAIISDRHGNDNGRQKPIPATGQTRTNVKPGSELQGKSAGASGWIVKPFNPEQLLASLSKVLHRDMQTRVKSL